MKEYCSRIESKFLVLLNSIESLPNNVQYRAFFDLIISIRKSSELLKKYYPQIKKLFIVLLNSIDKLPSRLKNYTYSLLIQAVTDTELENELALKQWVEKNPSIERRII